MVGKDGLCGILDAPEGVAIIIIGVGGGLLLECSLIQGCSLIVVARLVSTVGLLEIGGREALSAHRQEEAQDIESGSFHGKRNILEGLI